MKVRLFVELDLPDDDARPAGRVAHAVYHAIATADLSMLDDLSGVRVVPLDDAAAVEARPE